MTTATDTIGQNRKLAGSTVILVFGKAVGTVSMIVLFIILSRLFSPEEYGSFRQVLMINKGLLEIFALSMPLSIYYFLSRLPDERKKMFIAQSLVVLAALGLLCSVLVYALAGPIADKFDNPALERLLMLFALYPLFVLPTIALESVLVTLGQTRRYAIFLVVDKMVMLALAVVATFVYRSIAGLFVVLLAFSFVELLAALALVRYSVLGLSSRGKAVSLREQFAVALPSGLANIVGLLNVELDKLVVSLFFSVERFARYANGAFDIPFIGTVASATTSVLMPEYVKSHESGDRGRILELWHGAIVRVAVVFVPLIVFLFCNARPFVTLMFSDKYADSATIFRIYLIANLPRMTWYGPLLVSMGHTREPLIGSVLSLLSNLALNLLFIRWIGFAGPAVATVVTSYILVGYFLFRIRSEMKVGWTALYPWRPLAVMMGLSAAAAWALLPVMAALDLPSIVTLGAGYAVYMALLIVLFRLLGLVTRDDVGFVTGYASRLAGRRTE